MFLFLHLITQVIIVLQHINHISHQIVGQRFPHHCDVWHVLNFPLCCIHFAKTACSHCRQAKYVPNSPDHCSHMNQSLLDYDYCGVTFSFAPCILANYTDTILLIAEAEDWTAMKERDTEADPLNAP